MKDTGNRMSDSRDSVASVLHGIVLTLKSISDVEIKQMEPMDRERLRRLLIDQAMRIRR